MHKKDHSNCKTVCVKSVGPNGIKYRVPCILGRKKQRAIPKDMDYQVALLIAKSVLAYFCIGLIVGIGLALGP